MKIRNWEMVDAATGAGSKIPAGGYVITMTKVEDVPSKECIEITYDIAEGEFKDHYSDEFARTHPYIHQFRRWYSDKAENYFKRFLECVEASNANFDITVWQGKSDEHELCGLIVGATFGVERYTNERGEDKERLVMVDILPASDIRAGNFAVPEVSDKRKVTTAPAASSTSTDTCPDENLPF